MTMSSDLLRRRAQAILESIPESEVRELARETLAATCEQLREYEELQPLRDLLSGVEAAFVRNTAALERSEPVLGRFDQLLAAQVRTHECLQNTIAMILERINTRVMLVIVILGFALLAALLGVEDVILAIMALIAPSPVLGLEAAS